jgi:hypothetical protein
MRPEVAAGLVLKRAAYQRIEPKVNDAVPRSMAILLGSGTGFVDSSVASLLAVPWNAYSGLTG